MGGAIHRIIAKGPMFSCASSREPSLSLRPTVTELEVHDIRFPTPEQHDGSDAVNPDPDYSAAYVVLRTNAADGAAAEGARLRLHDRPRQ